MNRAHLAERRKAIAEHYLRGKTARKLVDEFAIGLTTVLMDLHMMGVPRRPRGWKRASCLDCGAQTMGTKRCSLHTRIRIAELKLDWWREKHRK